MEIARSAGGGNITSLLAVAKALGHGLSPLPSALANKRRWQRVGSRALCKSAGVSRPTVQSIEQNGQGRVASFAAMCTALDEPLRLRVLEETWWTPPELIEAIMKGCGIEQFDLDPASPADSAMPKILYGMRWRFVVALARAHLCQPTL